MSSKVMFIVFALITAGFSVAQAGQRDNFKICSQSDSWMKRFGNYVIAFDQESARNYCSSYSPYGPQTYRQAVCYVNGTYLKAGYYCEERYGN